MIEILTCYDVESEFKRLGISPKLLWQGYAWEPGERLCVHGCTEEEFQILCDDPAPEGTWLEAGWRYDTGCNLAPFDTEFIVNGEKMLGYARDEEDEDQLSYDHLLQYICDECGASQPRNVMAVSASLSRANNMTLSELYDKYQTRK